MLTSFLYVYFNKSSIKSHEQQYVKNNNSSHPKGIRISTKGNSSQEIEITWYCESQASDPKLTYSKSSVLLDNFTEIPNQLTIASTYIYTASLQDLDVNCTYYYQIGSNSTELTEILNFTTMPSRKVNHLKFLIYGDSRTGREVRRTINNEIMKNFPDLQFYIHTGDIIDDGRIQTQWNDYFQDVQNLTSRLPGYYIEGNHERVDGEMYGNIPLPSNGVNSYYYSIELGPIEFVGLNTNRDDEIQASWLGSILESANNDNLSAWKIVFMHEPIFNSRADRADRTDLISSWCPLFEENGIDVIFAGHNHYYERSYPMNRFNEFDNSSFYNYTNPEFPIYLTTGGAGAPLYTRDMGDPTYIPSEYWANYNSTYHFVIADLFYDQAMEQTNLTISIYALPEDSGIFYPIVLIDNFTVSKRGAFLDVDTPFNSQLFGQIPLDYNISINRKKTNPSWFTIDSAWYSLNGSDDKHFFSGTSGVIDELAWNDLGNGSFSIDFFINDSLGNIITDRRTCKKDLYPPEIKVNSPSNNTVFGKSAPSINISILDPHLDRAWYRFNNDSSQREILDSQIMIDPTEWSNLPNGSLVIEFSAIDIVNNTIVTRLYLMKDIYGPNIVIISPNSGQAFKSDPPSFEVRVTDWNLESMWYNIDNGVNVTFTGNFTLSLSLWMSLSQGEHVIFFFANDSVGNLAVVQRIIEKELDASNDDGKSLLLIIFLSVIIASFISVILFVRFKDRFRKRSYHKFRKKASFYPSSL
jgi:hypothetical protein